MDNVVKFNDFIKINHIQIEKQFREEELYEKEGFTREVEIKKLYTNAVINPTSSKYRRFIIYQEEMDEFIDPKFEAGDSIKYVLDGKPLMGKVLNVRSDRINVELVEQVEIHAPFANLVLLK